MGIKEKYAEQQISLEKALADFKKALNANMAKYDEIEQNWIKNAQVQKFEFCIELLWKTVKSYFETQNEFYLTPKQNIKALFLHNIITEALYIRLLTCIDDRNKLSHIYKLEVFDDIAGSILNHYEAIFECKNCIEKYNLN